MLPVLSPLPYEDSLLKVTGQVVAEPLTGLRDPQNVTVVFRLPLTTAPLTSALHDTWPLILLTVS